MTYTLIKAVHIVFIVSYFAGLFYMVRLFIYHVEALDKPLQEKNVLCNTFRIMESRLWNIITVPSGIIVLASGLSMLYLNSDYLLSQSWVHLKLTGVALLIGYHLITWRMVVSLKKDKINWTSLRLRMFNEVATLLLFLIVFVAILKNQFLAHWYWSLICFVGIGVLIMLIVRFINSTKK